MIGRTTIRLGPSLESLVRPFQGLPFGLAIVSRVSPPAVEVPGLATLTFSSRVSMETVTVRGAGWTVKFSERELSRKTNTVRVENPEDANQYVDVEVAEEITVRDQYGKTYKLKLVN